MAVQTIPPYLSPHQRDEHTCTGLALSTHVLSMYYLKVHAYWQGFGISNTQPWEVLLDINTL